MDYEKKYKEALERMKRWAEGTLMPPDESPETLCMTIFPELAESEDEKIRQSLLAYIKGESKRLDTKKWIAYLEKQKEPHYTKRNALFDKCVENCDPKVMKEVSDKVDEMLGKEQKPVEYLDKDKVYAIMTKLTNLSYSQLIPINSDEYKKLDEITTDVRSLLDYPIEQKPAEWSEEDENVIETLIRELRLNAQFEFAVRKLGLDYIQTLTVLDKCRRLCPQSSWKPSEEQMEAFKGYIEEFQARAEAAVGGWNNFDVMIRLYEQLKKL